MVHNPADEKTMSNQRKNMNFQEKIRFYTLQKKRELYNIIIRINLHLWVVKRAINCNRVLPK
jgi:hypothetical protein